jgi:hypothetical protein
MAKFSRRKLIGGGAAAALALNGAAHARQDRADAGRMPPTALASKPDPVLARVTAWIADRDAIDAMMRQWQDQEVALCETCKRLGMPLTRAYSSRLPEARAMRELDRKIKTGLQRLERQARRLVLMRPRSVQGALAKVRMGLKIQGPFDWEDYAFALAQDGCEQLARMLASEV